MSDSIKDPRIQRLLEPMDLGLNSLTSDHRHPGVYALHHVRSGKIYAGRAGCLQYRVMGHSAALRKGVHVNRRLQCAYDQDPGFKVSFVKTKDREESIELEQKAIDYLFDQKLALNISTDASKSGFGAPRTDQWKSTMSLKRKELWNRPERRQYLKERGKEIWKRREYQILVRRRTKEAWDSMSTEDRQKLSADRSQALRRKYQNSPEYRKKVELAAARRRRQVCINGVTYTHALEASEKLGITLSSIKRRLRSSRFPTYWFVD